MARITFTGIEGTMDRLDALEAALKDRIIGKMVYDGADIVADAVREEIQRLPTDDRFVRGGALLRGPGSKQKRGLLDSLGVSHMRDDDGFLNVSIGFDGYNQIKTKRWPQGQPNQMVARSVVRGTSFMEANPFFKAAVKRARSSARNAMKKTADQELQRTWFQR